MKDYLAALKVRKEALAFARHEFAKVRPANGNGRGDPDRRMTYEAFMEEYERESNARFIDRVVLKPNPKGKAGPKVDPAERVDVYFTGTTEPFKPTYGKVSKKDAAIIERHMAEVAAR